MFFNLRIERPSEPQAHGVWLELRGGFDEAWGFAMNSGVVNRWDSAGIGFRDGVFKAKWAFIAHTHKIALKMNAPREAVRLKVHRHLKDSGSRWWFSDKEEA
jgi:hypothetical protein